MKAGPLGNRVNRYHLNLNYSFVLLSDKIRLNPFFSHPFYELFFFSSVDETFSSDIPLKCLYISFYHVALGMRCI